MKEDFDEDYGYVPHLTSTPPRVTVGLTSHMVIPSTRESTGNTETVLDVRWHAGSRPRLDQALVSLRPLHAITTATVND